MTFADVFFFAADTTTCLCFAINAARGTMGFGVFNILFAGVCDANRLLRADFVVDFVAAEASEPSFFSLERANINAKRGDRRTGVFTSSLFGVFAALLTFLSVLEPVTTSRLGAPKRLGVRPGVSPPRLAALFIPSLGDVRSTSPPTPRFAGSLKKACVASVMATTAGARHEFAGAAAVLPRGVVSRVGASLSKYASLPSSSDASASKSKYFGASNSHLRRVSRATRVVSHRSAWLSLVTV